LGKNRGKSAQIFEGGHEEEGKIPGVRSSRGLGIRGGTGGKFWGEIYPTSFF